MPTCYFSSPGAETATGDSHMSADTELCVCVCLSQCIESVVGGDDYSQSQVNKWTASIVERCLTQLVKQHKPYKYIGTFNSVSPPPCSYSLVKAKLEPKCVFKIFVLFCFYFFIQWHVLWCRKQEQASTQQTPATGTPHLTVRSHVSWKEHNK